MNNGKNIRWKKGYTLLELIIVLSILSIGTFILSPNLKVFSDKKAMLEMEYVIDGIIEFINEGKAYGRLKDTSVTIKLGKQELILLGEKSKIIDKFIFPQSIYIVAGDKLDITSMGKISKAQSIKVYSKTDTSKFEIITIKVGTSYVSRQKK